MFHGDVAQRRGHSQVLSDKTPVRLGDWRRAWFPVGAASSPRWGVFQRHHPWRAPRHSVQPLWLASKVAIPCVAAGEAASTVGAASSPRWGVFQRHHPWRAPRHGKQPLWLASKVAVPRVAARRPIPQWERRPRRDGASSRDIRGARPGTACKLCGWQARSWSPASLPGGRSHRVLRSGWDIETLAATEPRPRSSVPNSQGVSPSERT